MPVRVNPRRVITVDDSGMVTRTPTTARRAPASLQTSPRPVAAPTRPDPQRVIPIDDDGTRVYVPNYAARGNAVATTNSLVAAALPSRNTGVARSKYQMAAFESETYRTFRDVGANDRHLFAGQRSVWGEADAENTTIKQRPEKVQFANLNRQFAKQLSQDLPPSPTPTYTPTPVGVQPYRPTPTATPGLYTPPLGPTLTPTGAIHWGVGEYFAFPRPQTTPSGYDPLSLHHGLAGGFSETSTNLGILSLGLGIVTLASLVVFPPAAPFLAQAASVAGTASTVSAAGAGVLYLSEATYYEPGSQEYNQVLLESGEEAISGLTSLFIPRALNTAGRYFATLGGEIFPAFRQTALELDESAKLVRPIGEWLGNFLAVLFSVAADI